MGARKAPSPPPSDPDYKGPAQVKPAPPPAPPSSIQQQADVDLAQLQVQAVEYARSQITPLYQSGETPTQYERGMLTILEAAFMSGCVAVLSLAVSMKQRQK